MTLDEIAALSTPERRPEGMEYDGYLKLCFEGGVQQPISKAQFAELPTIRKAMDDGDVREVVDEEDADSAEKGMKKMAYAKDESYDLKKDEDEEAGAEDDMGGGDEDEAAGEETEVAEEDSGDEEEEKMEASKGEVQVSDLMKAIDAYAAVEDALVGTTEEPNTREGFLSARLDSGTISKSERSELGRIWAGSQEDTGQEDLLHKSLSETMQEDEGTSHLVDASEFLRTLVKGVDTRMTEVLGEVSRDGSATRELMKAQGSLIKSLATHAGKQDRLIKAMAERIEHVESSPAPRRAVTARADSARGREFAKSAVAETGDNTLSKSQVTDGLRALMIHASDSEDQGAMNRIAHATSLYEQTGSIPPNVLAAVRQVSN